MQVAKYQNTITLFLVQCPMKTSPSATLVHTQSWRAGLYKADIPTPPALVSPTAPTLKESSMTRIGSLRNGTIGTSAHGGVPVRAHAAVSFKLSEPLISSTGAPSQRWKLSWRREPVCNAVRHGQRQLSRGISSAPLIWTFVSDAR